MSDWADIQGNDYTKLLIPHHFEAFTYAPQGNQRVWANEGWGPEGPEPHLELDGLPLLLIAHIEPKQPMCHFFEKWVLPLPPSYAFMTDLRDEHQVIDFTSSPLYECVKDLRSLTKQFAVDGGETPVPEVDGIDPDLLFIVMDQHLERSENAHV